MSIYLLSIPFLIFLISVTLQLPLIFVLNIAIFFLLAVKGFSKKNKTFKVLVEDFFSVTTFYFRYLLQNIRWLLMSVPLFMLSEFIFGFRLKKTFYFSQEIKCSTTCFNKLSTVLSKSVQTVIELLDFFFMHIVQISAFVVLNFWLFSFIFSTTLKNFYEKNRKS